MEYLDKYGWPAFFLFTIGIFFWKACWPLIIKHLDQTSHFLMQSQEENKRLVLEFMAALERRDRISEDIARQLSEISNKLERIK